MKKYGSICSQKKGAHTIMWKVKQIFDGEYGCEERMPGEKTKCLVTLIDENGHTKSLNVEDDWLTNHGIVEGSVWPE